MGSADDVEVEEGVLREVSTPKVEEGAPYDVSTLEVGENMVHEFTKLEWPPRPLGTMRK